MISITPSKIKIIPQYSNKIGREHKSNISLILRNKRHQPPILVYQINGTTCNTGTCIRLYCICNIFLDSLSNSLYYQINFVNFVNFVVEQILKIYCQMLSLSSTLFQKNSCVMRYLELSHLTVFQNFKLKADLG